MANFFKITSITSTLPKRHPKKDVVLSIKYADGFSGGVKKLPAGAEIYISCNKLPTNVQKLNLEKLVIINRVTENEYKRAQRKPKNVIKKKPGGINIIKTNINVEKSAPIENEKNSQFSDDQKPTRRIKKKFNIKNDNVVSVEESGDEE